MTLVEAHSKTVDACCASSAARQSDGLTRAEAARRLAEHGPNRLPEVRGRGPMLRFLAQFHNVFIYVLPGAAIVTGALQHWGDTGVILAVFLANALIGFIQEGKAEAALAAMLGTQSLPLTDGILIIAVGAAFLTLIEIEKQIRLGLQR